MLRETINSHRRWISVLVIVLMLPAIWFIFLKSDTAESGMPEQAFFTVDDGKTWFVDGISKVPPFDHNGKVAYRCVLYTTDGGKTKFVSHLERYTQEAKKKAQEQAIRKDSFASLTMSPSDVEVKRPQTGDSGWVNFMSPEGRAITTHRASEGDTARIERVTP